MINLFIKKSTWWWGGLRREDHNSVADGGGEVEEAVDGLRYEVVGRCGRSAGRGLPSIVHGALGGY